MPLINILQISTVYFRYHWIWETKADQDGPVNTTTPNTTFQLVSWHHHLKPWILAKCDIVTVSAFFFSVTWKPIYHQGNLEDAGPYIMICREIGMVWIYRLEENTSLKSIFVSLYPTLQKRVSVEGHVTPWQHYCHVAIHYLPKRKLTPELQSWHNVIVTLHGTVAYNYRTGQL